MGGIFGVTAAVFFSVTLPWAQGNFGTPGVHSSGRETTAETSDTDQAQNVTEDTSKTATSGAISLEDFKVIYAQIHSMADQALDGLVRVSAVSSSTDLFKQVYESEEKASGLIVEIGQEQVFILTEKRILEGAQDLIVTLGDDTICQAKIEKTDEVSGMAVLSVDKSEIDEEELEQMRVLSFAADQNLQQGEPVIALGSPLENTNSMASGVVTSLVDTPVMDASYQLVNTDITGSLEGSGILLNMSGEVVGIITQKFGNNGQARISGISSDDVKEILKEMAGETSNVMLGITGKTVTESIAEELDMPEGFYVISVAADSPAMYYGIQSGDILVSMNNTKISDQKDYQNVLKQCKIGEEISVKMMRKVRDGYAEMKLTVQLEEKQ